MRLNELSRRETMRYEQCVDLRFCVGARHEHDLDLGINNERCH